LVAWAAAIATTAVVVASVVAPGRWVREGNGINLVIQTIAALVALLVAVIAFARFRTRRRVSDLMLVLGLAQLAFANLVLTALPLSAGSPVGARTVWAGTFTRLAGVLLLTAAAYVRPRAVDEPRRASVDTAVVLALTGALVAVAFAASAGLRLPRTAADPGLRLWDGSIAMTVVLALAAVLGVVAAAGFVKAHEREPNDELLAWLAVASLLAGGSHATTALSFLSTYSRYVSGADVLKLACYLVLLAGVAREVRGAWRDRAMAAVADERRRIARDLHDGLAQELAFIVTRSRSLARRTGNDEVWAVCSSAERALDESRRAIAALTRDTDEPLDVALTHTAEEVGDRLGTRVTLELDHDVSVGGDAREALVRITREAITNAARHGNATRVHVRLFADDALHLKVSDNGRGFDATAAPVRGRLGVTSMRERAEAVGGAFTISSKRPGGTDVEVVLP
jgi:signal transduction histidine kinase